MEDSAIRELIHEAIADYKRDKAERVREQKEDLEKLARACLEDMLTSHTKPKIAKSKTVRSKYIVRAEKLILDQVEEVETSSEIYFRCPPKILEMILPPTPRTTIDVLATQMVNEGAMPLKKAEVIAAIADRAQSDIREVISGSSEFEAQL